jgi:hypothetical protein
MQSPSATKTPKRISSRRVEEAAALLAALSRPIDNDLYPFSPRIRNSARPK